MNNTEFWVQVLKLKLGSEFSKNIETLLDSIEKDNKQLILSGVGSSIIHVPYLKVEKDYQLEKMEELGINTTCQMFEQCVNGVLYELKELKK